MSAEECTVNTPRIRIGDAIRGQWIVKGKLGEGSSGIVWLVADTKNEKVLSGSFLFLRSNLSAIIRHS